MTRRHLHLSLSLIAIVASAAGLFVERLQDEIVLNVITITALSANLVILYPAGITLREQGMLLLTLGLLLLMLSVNLYVIWTGH